MDLLANIRPSLTWLMDKVMPPLTWLRENIFMKLAELIGNLFHIPVAGMYSVLILLFSYGVAKGFVGDSDSFVKRWIWILIFTSLLFYILRYLGA